MLFDVFNNLRKHFFRNAPFGLKVQLTSFRKFRGIIFPPFKITFVINDYFQLIGMLEYFGERLLKLFRRKANPVPRTTEWVSA